MTGMPHLLHFAFFWMVRMLSPEAEFFIKRLGDLLAKKWERPTVW